ncbi:acyl-CoA thioesterase II [Phenylobacterium aquaticum]|uniref:acyl-CoA thioesterase n=1 Tax=Phenylobacterium aquaticum TaxID=1763816 RepID=UPI0026F2BE58|nr:thioesterase family protein [Phenylobacterium aquaticum]
MSPHPLDLATALEPLGEGRFRGWTHAAYWNMAGPFGGATAALMMQAVLAHPERRGRPVAQTVNFCAAVAKGEFEITVELVRDGRSTQHWNAVMRQGEVVVTTASFVTGAERDTWAHAPKSPPKVPPAAEVAPIPTAGRMPWFDRYEFRVMSGRTVFDLDPPGELAPADTLVWMRDLPERPLDYVALSALADTFLVRILLVRGHMAPVATVSLTTYFLANEATLAAQGSRPLLGLADARAFRHGFADQSAELWGDDGVLLAVSHQVTWFKE